MSEDSMERESPVAPIVLAIVFALLFAYPEFQAVSNLISYPAYAGPQTPWWLLIAGVVLPPVLYVAALLLGRRRPVLSRVLILAVGLGAANALLLSAVDWALALVR